MKKLKVHKDYKNHRALLLDLIANFESQGEIIVDGDRNKIKSFDLEGTQINIKRFKTPNVFNALVYRHIRKSKAKRSFEYAKLLESKTIGTPAPIAYFEDTSIWGLGDSYYVSKHIDYDFDFRDLIHQPNFPDRENILRQFTAFTFKLHENNIEFLDHSPGNTLIKTKGNGNYNFFLIDLNRMRFKSLNLQERLHNFRRLWLSKTMVKIIAEAYSDLTKEPFEKVYAMLLESSRAFQRKKNTKKLRKLGRRPKFKS
ncbi:lipopolysaccharide kinase InaA family protein [Winogradskyella maritima]|uniref:Lipopolysaccharide kinase InaA family protein n=1 Tax=Winogradskyella maritima TaxID=1517766 RepID=A0ABV8AK24_9FLAO|nr:lipopolysaccharide kinase InaA family protein [Winogradskyella maritima]